MTEDERTDYVTALIDGFQSVIFEVGGAQNPIAGKAGERGAEVNIDVDAISGAMMFVLSQLAVQDGGLPTLKDQRKFAEHIAERFRDHYRINEKLIADIRQRGFSANDD